MSKIFKYYDDWKDQVLTCPRCGWTGLFAEGSVRYFSELSDSSCPRCDYSSAPILAIVSYPTMAETEVNWDKLSDRERESFLARKRFLEHFEEVCLKSPNQLPELEGEELKLTWDFEGGGDRDRKYTVIRYGSQVVWKEPALWEGFERFEEVVSILKEKYGSSLVDVEPTKASWLYLYGEPCDQLKW